MCFADFVPPVRPNKVRAVSVSLTQCQVCFHLGVALHLLCTSTLILFLIFTDRMSRCCQPEEDIHSGNLRIASLLFVDDAVLLACSWVWNRWDESQHLQIWGFGSLPWGHRTQRVNQEPAGEILFVVWPRNTSRSQEKLESVAGERMSSIQLPFNLWFFSTVSFVLSPSPNPQPDPSLSLVLPAFWIQFNWRANLMHLVPFGNHQNFFFAHRDA